MSGERDKPKIGLLDPALDSSNMGDLIISESVNREVRRALPEFTVVRLPTQRPLSRTELRLAKDCVHFLVGGTNILNGNVPFYLQWKIAPRSYRLYRGACSLLGVGWWQYQDCNSVSAYLWRTLLEHGVNSVRDTYTKTQLSQIGVDSINTGCPTAWSLPDDFILPEKRSKVVFTITDYARDVSRDRQMIASLKRHYDELALWPQGAGDSQYARRLGYSDRVLDSDLAAFDSELALGDSDYFGTRLHAGIRAMQHGCRAVIVEVDNRAVEMGRDLGLPTVERNLPESRVDALLSARARSLSIPRAEIEKWRTVLSERFGELHHMNRA